MRYKDSIREYFVTGSRRPVLVEGWRDATEAEKRKSFFPKVNDPHLFFSTSLTARSENLTLFHYCVFAKIHTYLYLPSGYVDTCNPTRGKYNQIQKVCFDTINVIFMFHYILRLDRQFFQPTWGPWYSCLWASLLSSRRTSNREVANETPQAQRSIRCSSYGKEVPVR